ncbi:hypothetical protein [uncultured Deinococcus sp.]|uniref:hypothetical protein n=1 Tax=uncultured Deinococcus sp. TaxID=158789 RepID=UPI002590765D|nr:hypothetical protein [uncultured Deinococcus sp.]
MALTGTAKGSKKAAAPAAPTIRLKDLLDQLDREWAELRLDWGAEATDPRNTDEAGLLAYFHTCLRPALHWVHGDPYTVVFPDEYQAERLAGLCRYLGILQTAELPQVQAARERNLAGLRAAWPSYRDLAIPKLSEDGTSLLDAEVLPFTWDAIETLWQGPNWIGDGKAEFLPQFHSKASADFHLAALAVLFLNRQLRRKLTDLTPQGGN